MKSQQNLSSDLCSDCVMSYEKSILFIYKSMPTFLINNENEKNLSIYRCTA